MNCIDAKNIINFSNEKFQRVQQTAFYCKTSHIDESVTCSAQVAFQALSLEAQKGVHKPLAEDIQRLCKLFLRKKKESLDQSEDILRFKEALVDVLGQLELRMEDEDAGKQGIQRLQHDLKNQVLYNIFKKYYSVAEIGNGTIVKELAPYLGDPEKIAALSQHEGRLLQQRVLDHLQEHAVNRDSLMALMIRLKKEKYPDFNCYIVDACDLEECLESLKLKASKTEEYQVQLLVRTDVHYTAIIVQIKDRILQAAVMDAAKDEKGEHIALLLKKLNYQKVFIIGLEDRIQFDRHNCGFFSFDSAFQAYKCETFFELLGGLPTGRKLDLYSIAWKNMPPSFVRNTTSTSFIKAYAAKGESYKQDHTFEFYLNRHTACVDIGKDMPSKIHTVLATRVRKEGEKIQKMVGRLSSQELLETVVRFSAQKLIKD